MDEAGSSWCSHGGCDESRKNKGLERFFFDKHGYEPYHTASMPGDFPDFLDLSRVGGTPVVLAGRIELRQLPRLRGLARADGFASLHLQALEEQGRRRVNGQIRADLELTCQRCLGPMQYSIHADINLMWVRAADSPERVPEGYDAIVSATGRVNVADLVEDELLLALPMVARHGPSEKCMARLAGGGKQPAAAAGPFALLKALKRH